MPGTELKAVGEQQDPVPIEVRKGLLLEMAVLVSVLFVPTFLGQFLGFSSLTYRLVTPEGMLYRIVSDGTHLLLILYVAFVLRRSNPVAKLGFDFNWDIPIGILLFCASRVIWTVVSPLTSGRSAPLVPTLHEWEGPLWSLLLLTLAIATGAFYQELLMRWYLISRLEQIGTRTWQAVVISTILFSAWHIYLGPAGAIHAVCAGLLYATCFVLTRRIGAIVIAHFLWNFILYYQYGHL